MKNHNSIISLSVRIAQWITWSIVLCLLVISEPAAYAQGGGCDPNYSDYCFHSPEIAGITAESDTVIRIGWLPATTYAPAVQISRNGKLIGTSEDNPYGNNYFDDHGLSPNTEYNYVICNNYNSFAPGSNLVYCSPQYGGRTKPAPAPSPPPKPTPSPPPKPAPSPISTAPPSYPLYCQGPLNINAHNILFRWAPYGAGKEPPGPGECAWTDRGPRGTEIQSGNGNQMCYSTINEVPQGQYFEFGVYRDPNHGNCMHVTRTIGKVNPPFSPKPVLP